jgi:plastocyanin
MVYGKFMGRPVNHGLMRHVLALVATLSLAPASSVWAGDVAFTVVTLKGKPVADAVVAAYPDGPRPASIRFAWPSAMDQHNLQFDPFVLIVPVGAEVSFPNRDSVRHHVYSFSPAKAFELKLYGRDETRSVHFDKVGVVALGCNIHDSMVAFIKVVDTPYAAKTDAAGQVVLRGLPSGPVQVRVWHPYLKAPNNEIVRTVAVTSGADREAVQIDVRNTPDRRGAY